LRGSKRNPPPPSPREKLAKKQTTAEIPMTRTGHPMKVSIAARHRPQKSLKAPKNDPKPPQSRTSSTAASHKTLNTERAKAISGQRLITTHSLDRTSNRSFVSISGD
jgi:hypothetical protein